MPVVDRLRRCLIWAAVGAALLGFVGYAVGIYAPLALIPGSNQGPLFGIFLAGPLGTALGALLGGCLGLWGRLSVRGIWWVLGVAATVLAVATVASVAPYRDRPGFAERPEVLPLGAAARGTLSIEESTPAQLGAIDRGGFIRARLRYEILDASSGHAYEVEAFLQSPDGSTPVSLSSGSVRLPATQSEGIVEVSLPAVKVWGSKATEAGRFTLIYGLFEVVPERDASRAFAWSEPLVLSR